MEGTVKLVYPPGATPLNPNEIEGLLPSGIATQEDLNEATEQGPTSSTPSSGPSAVVDPDVLTGDQFIRELHRRMLSEVWRWAGKYRSSDKNIGGPWAQIPHEDGGAHLRGRPVLDKARDLRLDGAFWRSVPSPPRVDSRLRQRQRAPRPPSDRCVAAPAPARSSSPGAARTWV